MNKEIVYICIRTKKRDNINTIKSKSIFELLNKFPIIPIIIGQSYKILSSKPILSRMGKGKGKLLGYYKPIKKGNIIIEGFAYKEDIKRYITIMKKQGMFNNNSNYIINIYEINNTK